MNGAHSLGLWNLEFDTQRIQLAPSPSCGPLGEQFEINHMAYELYNTGYSKQYLAVDPTVSGNGLRAASSSDTPLQFTVSELTASFLRFTTTYAGSTLCLDVYGDEATVVHLATCGNYLGQQWWWTQESGSAKLSNNYTGSGWYLDVYSDTKHAFMSSGDFSGQYWEEVAVDGGSGSGTTTVSERIV